MNLQVPEAKQKSNNLNINSPGDDNYGIGTVNSIGFDPNVQQADDAQSKPLDPVKPVGNLSHDQRGKKKEKVTCNCLLV